MAYLTGFGVKHTPGHILTHNLLILQTWVSHMAFLLLSFIVGKSGSGIADSQCMLVFSGILLPVTY